MLVIPRFGGERKLCKFGFVSTSAIKMLSLTKNVCLSFMFSYFFTQAFFNMRMAHGMFVYCIPDKEDRGICYVISVVRNLVG